MCLAVPAKVIEIAPDGASGRVEVGGVVKPVSFALLDHVTLGDYVLIHVGFALSRIDPEEAKKTLALFAQMAEAAG
ncbi:MAG: hydrogenase assembly protein HupF [Alphaproteobacteria bacterium RIFOXYD12_FULL_60_8]|nr:MAG: hydrogenase assembly protein HupF [Alphaproteobacteria bacterium RIFOXYD12_FULL_60_8]